MPDSSKGFNLKGDEEAGSFRIRNHYLLAIAIDRYAHLPHLNNAVWDAKAFVRLLQEKYQFDPGHTTELYNDDATRRNIHYALDQMVEKVGPEDNFVLFFSGHGAFQNNRKKGFWIPFDAQKDEFPDYFPNVLIRDYIGDIQSHHSFIISDSCFSGSLLADPARATGAPLEDKPSRWLLTSGGHELVSDGRPGKHSPFASHLLDFLQTNKYPALPITALNEYVARLTDLNENQTPSYGPLRVAGHKDGQFYFRLKRDEERDWDQALAQNKIEPYNAYLDLYPGGKYEKEAEEKLAALEDERDWQTALRIPTIMAFRDYKKKHKAGKHLKEADKQIQALIGAPVQSVHLPVKPSIPHTDPDMVFVKGGTFTMGDVMGDKEWDDELPLHEVTLGSFRMGRYAVTFDEYDAFCEATGRKKPGDEGWSRSRRPAIHVSWYDAVEYCNWLSGIWGLDPAYSIDKNKQDPDNASNDDKLKWLVVFNPKAGGYRLPTEAQWEYAARQGGKKVRFGNGKDVADPKEINFNGTKDYKKAYSLEGEYRGKTVPVGSLNSPNELGLHDMSGNVWEWCWDWFGEYSSDAQTNPAGPLGGSYRVHRGGSWGNGPRYCRVASRDRWYPGRRFSNLGFRLVLPPVASE